MIPPPASDVVGLGLNAMDYIAVLPHFPNPEGKVPISELRLEPGGQVATALTACRRFGRTVCYIGSVGSDELGQAQLASLRREGVDTSNVRVVEGATSQVAFALVEQGVGERTILWHRDSRLAFPPEEVSANMIRAGRLLHLDGHDSAAALRAAQLAREAGMPIMIDIDRRYDDSTEELLMLVDYLIAAGDFAMAFTGHANPEDAVRALSERFPAKVVGVTMGAAGAAFLDEGRFRHFPAFDIRARDTTGAGDVFHGAFIHGVLEDWNLERTVGFAHAAAAMNCMHLGARAGIPTLGEVEEFLRTARQRGV